MSIETNSDNVDIDESDEGATGDINANMYSMHSEQSEIDENENLIELVVLDPDHALMQRFQKALEESLLNQFYRMQEEDRETTEDLRKHRDQHLEAGNELFTTQRELAKFQSNLDILKEDYQNACFAREKVEQNLISSTNERHNIRMELQRETKKMNTFRKEMDNIGLRLFYLRTAKEEIVGDIAVMKRAAEKAVEDLTKAEHEKMHQDFILDGLVSEVGRLKEDIALYEAQLVAQTDERCAAKQTLHEAQDEITSIILERKQLIHKWNSSLIDLMRRNETFFALNESLVEKKEELLVLENEFEGYRRNTRKENRKNEHLILLLKKNEVDITHLKKNISDSENKLESLKKTYGERALLLQSTEKTLSDILKDKNAQIMLTGNIHEEMERLSILRHSLEDKIVEEIRNRLSLKSSLIYSNKLTKKSRDKSRHIESDVVLMHNSLSNNSLRTAEIKAEVVEIQKYLDEMELEIADKNDTINKLEIELCRSKTTIDRKQVCIDKLNRQLEELLKVKGGVELGPLEIIISHLNKNLHLSYEEVTNLEQQWLNEQNEIVALFNTKEELFETIRRLKQQHTLLRQKQLRLEGYILQEDSQRNDIEKELVKIQTDLVKVNRLIFKEKNAKDTLEKSNILAETDFVRALKEEELQCIQMETKIDELKQEHEETLKYIVEKQWQVMMYEKKIQLLQEAELTMKSDLGQGEIMAMKKEIHRMDLRYLHLQQQQELLIQDMEKSVMKRDIMTNRGEALMKIQDKVVTKGTTENDIKKIKRKIKETLGNIRECVQKAKIFKKELQELRERMVQQKVLNQQAEVELRNWESQVDEMADLKYTQLMQLQHNQQTHKHYIELREKKYSRMCKTNAALEKEKSQQHGMIQSLLMIVDRLCCQDPRILPHLQPVRLSITDIMNR